MLLNIGLETIIYVNHKSKALLFMKMQVLMLQQEQLKTLFDTVPGKVLILSKTNGEASAPKSLYSNREMNRFFGCNVVKKDSDAKGCSNAFRAPTRRQIFEREDHDGAVKRKKDISIVSRS